MMISEQFQTIILANAKYRDVAPSALTKRTLVKQLLLDKDGLLSGVRTQQARLDLFRNHSDAFQENLKPERPWGEYDIQSFVITKQAPVFSGYQKTKVQEAQEWVGGLPQ